MKYDAMSCANNLCSLLLSCLPLLSSLPFPFPFFFYTLSISSYSNLTFSRPIDLQGMLITPCSWLASPTTPLKRSWGESSSSTDQYVQWRWSQTRTTKRGTPSHFCLSCLTFCLTYPTLLILLTLFLLPLLHSHLCLCSCSCSSSLSSSSFTHSLTLFLILTFTLILILTHPHYHSSLSICLSLSSLSGACRGYAFVEFEKEEDMTSAYKKVRKHARIYMQRLSICPSGQYCHRSVQQYVRNIYPFLVLVSYHILVSLCTISLLP